MIDAAAARLARSVDEVNALNVYPVPDGDTGTNMLHTIRTALAHARNADATLASVSAAAAHGALMGARGNSGVILSQILRGMKDAFADRETVDAASLSAAFAAARTHAYAAVVAPAQGTILTALDAMSTAVRGHADADAALRAAVDEGARAVERTKQDNPMNRAAGVVDAGARGLWLLLDGALAEVEGRVAAEDAAPRLERPSPTLVGSPAPVPSGHVASWEGAYDVQYLITRPMRSAEELRAEMLEFGADCVLVVGDETAVKVHVHTLQPDQIVRLGLTAGRISDVVVEDLDAMTAEHERATGIRVAPPRPRAALGLVAVVPGEGFAEIARASGAVPLRGGATMNPSAQELLDAIRAANADHVIVLPNDRNVVLAAQQAARLADQPVTVVPTRNIGEGMAALVAFDTSREPSAVAAAMERATASAHGVEVTRAIRASDVDGRRVRAGEAMALLDGRLVATGADELDVLADAARQLVSPNVITIFYGSGVGAERAERARERVAGACPDAEVELLEGGQPHYPFLVSAE